MKTKRILLLYPALLALLLLFSAAALAGELPEDGSPAPGGTLDNVEEGETLSNVWEDETLPVNNGTINYNDGTVEANGSTGIIHNNNGTVALNQEGGSILTNSPGAVIGDNEGSVGTNRVGLYDIETGEEIYPPALIRNSSGSVHYNMGAIENNSGEIEDNWESAVVQNNTGSIEDNSGAVFHNTGRIMRNSENGSVLNAAGGVIEYNAGTVYDDGGEVGESLNPDRSYVKIPIERDERALVTGAVNLYDPDSDTVSAFAGEAWIKQNSFFPPATSITFSPAEGYVIDGFDCDAVDNGDGTWTIRPDSMLLMNLSLTISLHPSVDIGEPPAFGQATFTLPAELRTIEAGAFEGDTSITVVDAHGCTAIGAGAFKGCTGLTQILLPKNCRIASNAFALCDKVFVYAPAGGTTQTACSRITNCVFVDYTEN